MREERIYLSVDTPTGDGHDNIRFPVEVLNNSNPPGLPVHSLKIKKGHILVLLRNLNVTEGLCNGTRLAVTDMSDNVLTCKVLVGPSKDRTVFIFKQSLTSSSQHFKFQRLQFPVKHAYALTIHKSQGQTIQKIGLYLSIPVFSHGMLYVALSRVTKKSNLKVFIKNAPGQGNNIVPGAVVTKNFVDKSVLTQPER